MTATPISTDRGTRARPYQSCPHLTANHMSGGVSSSSFASGPSTATGPRRKSWSSCWLACVGRLWSISSTVRKVHGETTTPSGTPSPWDMTSQSCRAQLAPSWTPSDKRSRRASSTTPTGSWSRSWRPTPRSRRTRHRGSGWRISSEGARTRQPLTPLRNTGQRPSRWHSSLWRTRRPTWRHLGGPLSPHGRWPSLSQRLPTRLRPV